MLGVMTISVKCLPITLAVEKKSREKFLKKTVIEKQHNVIF